MLPRHVTDPCEIIIAAALNQAEIPFAHEKLGLDFYLPDFDLYIEVKQLHSPRIAVQMERAKNVIAVQGKEACIFMAALIAGDDPK